MIYITGAHMSGGTRHEHIIEVRWLNSDTGVSNVANRSTMVDYIEGKKNPVKVGGEDRPVAVQVVHPTTGTPFLRTRGDKDWTDNLLRLPRY